MIKKLPTLLIIFFLVSCGPSLDEKQEISQLTCNVMAATRNMDSAIRLREVNSAREQLGEARFLGTDDDIIESFEYGICELLVLNDPNYASILAEKKRPQPQYMLSFALEDLDGNMRNISEWSEQKILINFWATWCAPCRREMPMFQTLHLNQQEHGIQIIGIAVDQNELARAFINEYGISFPILIGQSNAYEIMKDLGNTSLTLPYTLLVEPGGLITWNKHGEVTSQDLPLILGD